MPDLTHACEFVHKSCIATAPTYSSFTASHATSLCDLAATPFSVSTTIATAPTC